MLPAHGAPGEPVVSVGEGSLSEGNTHVLSKLVKVRVRDFGNLVIFQPKEVRHIQ
jgi:hypothetical protein